MCIRVNPIRVDFARGVVVVVRGVVLPAEASEGFLPTAETSIPFLANLSQLPLERTLFSFRLVGLSVAAAHIQ